MSKVLLSIFYRLEHQGANVSNNSFKILKLCKRCYFNPGLLTPNILLSLYILDSEQIGLI